MRRILSTCAATATVFSLACAPGLAADLAYKAPPPVAAAPSWFVEGDLGAGFGHFNDLSFLNPVAAGDPVGFGLLSPTSGNFILLNGKSLNSTSFTGGASVGYFFTSQYFAKLSYQYFGRFSESGFADFAALGNVRQDLSTTAQGLLAGLGADFNITPAIFVEPSAQIGVGFLNTTGFQGANVGLQNPFPSATHTNFIAGAGLGVGYHVTATWDVIAAGNYYYLGSASTGVTGNPPPGTMNVGEQLQSNLNVVTATVTARFKF